MDVVVTGASGNVGTAVIDALRASPEIGRIVAGRLGWDITDYGEEKFDEMGLFLFTVRNGRAEDLSRGKGMLYAEKIMISRKDQYSPMHRHVVKAEDIINRGGGKLVLELFMPDAEGGILFATNKGTSRAASGEGRFPHTGSDKGTKDALLTTHNVRRTGVPKVRRDARQAADVSAARRGRYPLISGQQVTRIPDRGTAASRNCSAVT